MPSSVADNLLWPLLTLHPHFQGTKQILVEQSAFLYPMEPLSFPPLANPYSKVSALNT